MGHTLDTLSVDYESVRSKLIAVLQDHKLIKDLHKSSTGIMIIELLAYVTELMNFYINEARNEMNIKTAQRRENLIELAKSFGYDLFYGVPSRGDVYYAYSLPISAGKEMNIPRYTYLRSKQGVNFMTIEPYSSSTTSGEGYMRVRQGTIKQANLGTSDGQSFQKFKIPTRFVTVPNNYDFPLVDVVLECEITPPGKSEAEKWIYDESLLLATDQEKTFTTEMDDENYVWISFGDGIFGKIPELGSKIIVYYEENVGTLGNIDGIDVNQFNVNRLAKYNTTSLVELEILSAQDYSNGRDPDDNETMKENISRWTRIQNRAISPNDFEDAYDLHKGVIRSYVLGFNEIYKTVSRDFSITGSPTDVSNFIAASSHWDLSADFSRPWQYFAVSGDALTATDGLASAFETCGNYITGFAMGQTMVWPYNALGALLNYFPDYHTLTCGGVAENATTASPLSGWFSRITWSNDKLGASAAGHPGGALLASMRTELQDWLNAIAQPSINISIDPKVPEWVFVNVAINIEKDPRYYGSNETITNGIKDLMWKDWGFKAKDSKDVYKVEFGTKTYLNQIEFDISDQIDGLVSVHIPGDPSHLLSGDGTALTDGLGFNMWTFGSSGESYAVTAQEYRGNYVSGGAATSSYPQSGAAQYTSAYGVFWNPDERSLQFKNNQIPIFIISGITFT